MTAPVDRVVAAYRERYGEPPSVVVLAPGRVNLIGEHTDYALLPVMPMAIDRRVVVAAGPGPGRRLQADSLTLPAPLDLGPEDRPRAGWHRYVAAAARVLGQRGTRLLLGGDLPATGGLSSSSAVTVGVIAALDRLWGLGLDRTDYPDLGVQAERSIGVEGGSMDQTVISLAAAGTALRIDFHPPARRPVPLPAGLGLVAAYSGTPAPKGDDARDAYNLRVVAGRAAAVLLTSLTGCDAGLPPALGRVCADLDLAAGLPETITAREAARRSATPVETMVTISAGVFDAYRPLPVRSVAVHALSEAGRVDRAEEALEAGDLEAFGALLDASHASLVVFGASTPRLDRVVGAMRAGGALGARLTGAGFGGYALAAVPAGGRRAVVDAALAATGGPAFEVTASDGVG